MTAEDAGESHPSAAQDAEALNGLHGIFGAGRHVAAGRREQGRDGPFVSPQQLQRDEFGEVAQERLPASGFRLPAILFVAVSPGAFSDGACDSFCSITAKALVTSFRTAAKSVVSNDFFGLMTTSAATPGCGRDMRTAS